MRTIFWSVLSLTLVSVTVSVSFSLLSFPHLCCPNLLTAPLILCQLCLHCIFPQKANDRQTKIHYGLLLLCPPKPFSCLDLWVLLYAPAGQNRELPSLSMGFEKSMNRKNDEWTTKKEEKGAEGRKRHKWKRQRNTTKGTTVLFRICLCCVNDKFVIF